MDDAGFTGVLAVRHLRHEKGDGPGMGWDGYGYGMSWVPRIDPRMVQL